MNELDLKAMGMRLRKQRELLGYTRDELAEKLDVSSKFCSDIELGVKHLSVRKLNTRPKVIILSSIMGISEADSPLLLIQTFQSTSS